MDKKLLDALNKQINAEMYSAYLYLSMATNALAKGFPGVHNWLLIQSQEEMTHAMKMYDFLNERGENVVFSEIASPPSDWETISDIFDAVLEHEKKVSTMIRNIYKIAREVFDPETEIFLNWFITEQIEEEAHASEIVQKVKLSEGVPAGLFSIDRELAARPQLITITQNND